MKKTFKKNSQTLIKKRTLILLSLQMAVVGVLGWKIRDLQIDDFERYSLLAEENRVNIRIIPPKRGRIYDVKGNILADNKQNYKITLIREETKDPEKLLKDLSSLLYFPKNSQNKILNELNKISPFLPITVIDNISWTDFSKVAANLPSLPGLITEVGLSREYLKNESMAHIIGYVGPISKEDVKRFSKSDPLLKIPKYKIGKTGIERARDKDLRGYPGVSRLEVNAKGRVMRELENTPGESGKDFQLTIDSDLQEFAMYRTSKQSASTVVIDLENGNIKALCSTPSFDPNKFISGISKSEWDSLLESEKRPLSNKAVSDAYPPGSTFKMVVALTALELNIISPEEKIICDGYYEIGERRFHCWKEKGHKSTNLNKSLKLSCDVYFYEIARRVGIDAIAKTASKLGLNDEFNLPVSSISKGLIPTISWKKNFLEKNWRTGDTLNAGIGQGYVLTTPLQLAIMTARIATSRKITPQLINAVNGIQNKAEIIEKLNISENSLKLIKKGMFSVVNEKGGTAFKSRIINKKYLMAGKTGTSQVRKITSEERIRGITKNENLPWEKRDHALFVGYAPYNNPKYSISVIVEHGGGGSKIAAPIARDVMLFALKKGIPNLNLYPEEQRNDINKMFQKRKKRT